MAASLWKSAWRIAAAMLPAVCILVAIAKAQDSPTSPPTGAPTTPPPASPPTVTAQKPITSDRAPMFNADQDIAEMLLIDNNGEVAMAKLAESKVQNPSVLAFARRMMKDHTQMAQAFRLMAATMSQTPSAAGNATAIPAGPTLDLEPRATQSNQPGPNAQGPAPAGRSIIAGSAETPAAPGTAGTPTRAPLGSVPTLGSVPNSATVGTPGGLPVPGSTSTPGATAPSAPPPSAVAVPQATAPFVAGNQNRGGLDFLQVRRKVGQQCLTSATKNFDSMKPAEVEIAYMDQQIVAHQQMIETAKVLRLYASARLQSLIDRGIEMAESHLTEAKEVMGNLAQNPSESQTNTK